MRALEVMANDCLFIRFIKLNATGLKKYTFRTQLEDYCEEEGGICIVKTNAIKVNI